MPGPLRATAASERSAEAKKDSVGPCRNTVPNEGGGALTKTWWGRTGILVAWSGLTAGYLVEGFSALLRPASQPWPRLDGLGVAVGLTAAGLLLPIPRRVRAGISAALAVSLGRLWWPLAPFGLAALAALLCASVRARAESSFGRRRYLAVPVTVPYSDRLLHVHVLGPTGSGKSSSVLMPLIAQDLAHGFGVTLIEPKGDLARAAYRAALDAGQTVLWLDPDDEEAPHWNPLAGPGDVAAEGLAWALANLSEAGHPFYAAVSRLELLYSVLAVKEIAPDEADLAYLMRFLRQEGFRREVVAALHDVRTRAYFEEQRGRQNAARALEQRVGLLTRLELLLVNPRIRRLLSPPSDFDWDEALREPLTILSPLSLARLGDSARVLGTLFWHGLVIATYRRPEASRPPYFLYLDEFHQYVSPDLGDFLAMARGFGVGVVLAHQDLGQLSAELKAAVMANARQRVVLGGLSSEDRIALVPRFGDRFSRNLTYLARGFGVVERTVGGTLRPPVVVRLAHRELS